MLCGRLCQAPGSGHSRRLPEHGHEGHQSRHPASPPVTLLPALHGLSRPPLTRRPRRPFAPHRAWTQCGVTCVTPSRARAPRPCHGRCRCVSSESWPLSWSRVRGCGFQESSWGSPRPRPGRVVPWRGLGSRSPGCGASRVRGPLSSWEAAGTMGVLRAASEGPTHLLVADWCEHTRTWAQPWGRSRPGVSRWDAGAGRVFCCFQR